MGRVVLRKAGVAQYYIQSNQGVIPMLVMFSSDYFDTKQIDPAYAAEYEAVCKIPEFKTILFNHDAFVEDGTVKIYPKDYYTGDCILRSWMLTPEQYAKLYSHLSDVGIRLINSPKQYNACHLLPNALPYLERHTPHSLIYPHGAPIDWNVVNKTFRKFMVKDYVKSVKETDFPAFFETPVEADEMNTHIAKFTEHRGKLYTGGIVLRDFVDFKRYGETTNEYRAFCLCGRLLSVSRNSNQSESCPFVPSRFANSFTGFPSNYYTVDFAEAADGTWIVLETGDGQVSGLSPNQFVFKYYDDMREIVRDHITL